MDHPTSEHKTFDYYQINKRYASECGYNMFITRIKACLSSKLSELEIFFEPTELLNQSTNCLKYRCPILFVLGHYSMVSMQIKEYNLNPRQSRKT